MYSSTSWSSSSPETRPRHWLSIPKGYKFLQILGHGGFGTVVKCKRRGTEQIVAVKIGKHHQDLRQEAFMLRPLMRHSLDKCDIITLGCVMAIMIFGFMLFPARIDYDALQFIHDLLGPPPQRLINAAQKSKECFKKTDSDQWMLKTPEEYWGPNNYSRDNRFYTFRSLDEGKMLRLELDNVTEADERRECMELLKEMLTWDERERITPAGILNHPFITKSHIHSTSRRSSGTSEALPSGVVMVRPAAPTNMIHLEETPGGCFVEGLRLQSFEDDMNSACVFNPRPAAAPATSIHMDNTELPPNTSGDSGEEKKNSCERFFSWMTRMFSCSYVDDLQE